MRILIYGINFHPEPTGVGKYTGEMAGWLAGRGHEVRVVTAPPSYPQWRVFPGYRSWRYSREALRLQNGTGITAVGGCDLVPGIEIFRCPIWISENPNGLKRLLHLASFGLSSVPAIVQQIGWSPDIVLLVEPTLFCALQALLLARWSGAKSWLHVQDFEVDAAFELGDLSSSRLRDWAFAIERRILTAFDRVSAISHRMVERLLAKGVHPARCTLFPNWVDTRKIYPLAGPSPFRKELGIAESTVVALYSGSMGKKHGLELLVEAAIRLSHCSGLQFVFCGEGPSRRMLNDKVKDLPNVTLLPVQPANRLNDLLNLPDIHLLPQLSDAADLVMPSKLTGMMASGRAIVATAHPGTQLFGALEGRGLVSSPGDVNAFVSALLRLAEDPFLRARLGQEARTYAVSHLNRHEVLHRFERSMLEICGILSPDTATRLRPGQAGELPVKQTAMAAGAVGED
jgi:colanic acid biosynthesis glycosyl transferase WcaI